MSTRQYGRKTISYPTVQTQNRTSRFSQRLASGVTISDFFCGAGGSSTGLKIAGADVVVASNHWDLAIQTHERNHPETHHICEDLSAADPRRFPSTTGAWFSPECTWHSPAGGRKRPTTQQSLWTEWEPDENPTGERSRATMWDVVRFSEAHRYRFVIVENVMEVLEWTLFNSWWSTMLALGYRARKVCLNSMFCWPTPQSRDRLYMVFSREGDPEPNLDVTPLAYCARCECDLPAVQSWKPGRSVGKYKRQYVYCCAACASEVTPYYYAAANAIDWSLPIQRIGDRKHALKPRTMQRIQAGLEKYGRNPLLLVANHRTTLSNARPALTDPWPTQLTNQTLAMMLPDGRLVSPNSFTLAGGEGGLPQAMFSDALSTQTASGTTHMIVPWLLEIGHGGPENASRTRAVSDPLPTVHTMGGVGMAAYIVPLDHQRASGKDAYPATDALHAQTTRQEQGLMMAPYLVDSGGVWESEPRGIEQPYPTQSIRRQPGLLMAPYVVVSHEHQDATSVTDPLTTVVAGGNHHHLTLAPHPFITTYHGVQGAPASAIEDALATADTHMRHGLAFPPQPDLPDVEDCYYRTLRADEIKRAMGFPADYVLLGDARSQVKQAGNAVTPPAAKVLAERMMATLQ